MAVIGHVTTAGVSCASDDYYIKLFEHLETGHNIGPTSVTSHWTTKEFSICDPASADILFNFRTKPANSHLINTGFP